MGQILKDFVFLVFSLCVFTNCEPVNIRCDYSDLSKIVIVTDGGTFTSKCPDNKICDKEAISSNYCVDRPNANTISPTTISEDITTTTPEDITTTTLKDITTTTPNDITTTTLKDITTTTLKDITTTTPNDITTTTLKDITTTIANISTPKNSFPTVPTQSTAPPTRRTKPPIPNIYRKCNDGFGKTNPCRIDPVDSSYYIKCIFQFYHYFIAQRRLCSELKNDGDCKSKNVCQTA